MPKVKGTTRVADKRNAQTRFADYMKAKGYVELPEGNNPWIKETPTAVVTLDFDEADNDWYFTVQAGPLITQFYEIPIPVAPIFNSHGNPHYNTVRSCCRAAEAFINKATMQTEIYALQY